MPIFIEEKFESRRVSVGQNASVDLIYAVYGALGNETDADALAGLEQWSPVSFDVFGDGRLVLNRSSVDIDPVGPYLWNGVVHYGATSEGEITFDVSAGTQHITQSIETVYVDSTGGGPDSYRDNKGAIGVTDTSVEGVDILVPQFSFSETYIKDAADVTTAYIQTLGRLVGTVNDAPFRGWSAGEVLFKGATGRRRSIGQWEITYHYAYSPNRTDIVVGDMTGIQKEGWHYLWVQYEEAEDTSAKALIRKPIQVNVEKVYENGDFSLLDIGTA